MVAETDVQNAVDVILSDKKSYTKRRIGYNGRY